MRHGITQPQGRRCTVGDTALSDTARLVNNMETVNGVPIGYAAHALIFSNGAAVGALPAKGEAAVTVVAART